MQKIMGLDAMRLKLKNCNVCEGTGWICENCKTVWQSKDGDSCCGAGEPCECNENGDIELDAVIASSEPETVKRWAH